MRDPRKVIQLQISSARSEDNFSKPAQAGVFCSPLNYYAGKKACVAVEKAVKTDHILSVTWRSEVVGEVQSTVGNLQIYLNKSQN